ncbi:MAG: Lar family restriction alleviation protein [Anaerolineae bacterium]|nr:Lar family restriction alleviation protein [Anaerolineae bacterium]
MLLPCPFCGSENLETDVDYLALEYGGPKVYSVMCVDCGCCGPETNEENGAKQGWNSRLTKRTDLGQAVANPSNDDVAPSG